MTAAQRTAVIITALPEERDAVLEHLRDVTEEPELRGSIYRRGIFDERCDPCNVALAEIGAGNEGAAAEAERVIAHYSPQVALFVGVAGGIKDVKHGDVIVSSKIYGYESGKDQRKGFKPRPSVHLPSYGLEQRARYEAGEPEWRQRIKECNTWQQLAPVVKVGPIAAGEKVLSSNRTQIYKFIREHYGDALAVEMEGHGFLLGVHRNHPTLGIVVRSISDCISDKSEASDVTWQPIAARHAAAFAFQMLAKLSLTEGERASRSRSNSAPEPPTESRIQAELEVTYDGFSDDGKCPRITFSVNNKTKDLVILTDVRARIVDFREVTFFLGLGADSSIPRTQLVLNFGRVSAKVTDSVMQQGSGPPRYRPISLVDPDRVVHIRPGSAESYSLSVSGTTDYRGLGHVCLLMIEVVISSNDDGASDRLAVLLGIAVQNDKVRPNSTLFLVALQDALMEPPENLDQRHRDGLIAFSKTTYPFRHRILALRLLLSAMADRADGQQNFDETTVYHRELFALCTAALTSRLSKDNDQRTPRQRGNRGCAVEALLSIGSPSAVTAVVDFVRAESRDLIGLRFAIEHCRASVDSVFSTKEKVATISRFFGGSLH